MLSKAHHHAPNPQSKEALHKIAEDEQPKEKTLTRIGSELTWLVPLDVQT